MAQKIVIAPIDERGGGPDKGDDRSAQGRRLPGLGPNAVLSVDREGNLAISRLIGTSVGGLHHQGETPALVRCHPGVAARRFVDQYLPKPENGFDPVRQIVVKWQDDRGL